MAGIVELYGWGTLLLLLAAAALVVARLRTRPRSQPIHCPGPPGSVLRLADPRRWFVRHGCWYNLTGLPEQEDGVVRCPECGTTSAAHQRLRDGRRWRPLAAGVALTALAGVCFGVPWVRYGSWSPAVPTVVLVGSEYLGKSWQPRAMRSELYGRIWSNRTWIDPVSVRLLVPSLIGDLRDDDVRGNADRAYDLLESLGQTAGQTARHALERELAAGDEQSRTIAAHLLRGMCPDEPSDALLAACVEDLRHDEVRRVWFDFFDARAARDYLLRFPHRIEPLLSSALRSDDRQQRTVAAVLAGHCDLDSLIDAAAPILIANLRDDEVYGNAKTAAPALFRFGPEVIPYLLPCFESDDRQQRDIARAIVTRLQHRRDPTVVCTTMPLITEACADPLGLPAQWGEVFGHAEE